MTPSSSHASLRAGADADASVSMPGPLLLTAVGVAHELGLSVRTVRRLDAAGKLPKPVRIGGAVRWHREEIRLWIQAGCPDRQRWEVEKQTRDA